VTVLLLALHGQCVTVLLLALHGQCVTVLLLAQALALTPVLVARANAMLASVVHLTPLDLAPQLLAPTHALVVCTIVRVVLLLLLPLL
jgi:hypothetical protein